MAACYGAGMPARHAKPHCDNNFDIADLLAKVPLFAGLPPGPLERACSATRKRHLKRGQFLFQLGDPPMGLFAVVVGQVKLAIPSQNGDERVLDISTPGQVLGTAVMFLDQPCPATAVALSESVVLCTPKDAVLELLRCDTGFAERLIVNLSTRVVALSNELGSCSLRSATQRVAEYLLQHCPEDDSAVALEITLPLRKQLIASRLSITPETLSRAFHELSDANLVGVRGGQLEIPSVRQLRVFAG